MYLYTQYEVTKKELWCLFIVLQEHEINFAGNLPYLLLLLLSLVLHFKCGGWGGGLSNSVANELGNPHHPLCDS